MSAKSGRLASLRHATGHLAWPAERQRRYLDGLGVAPSCDELALEFDDALRPVIENPSEFALPPDLCAALRDLDQLLSAMTGGPPRRATYGSGRPWTDPSGRESAFSLNVS